jgi:pantetheine-phosphate adenylyltransferase
LKKIYIYPGTFCPPHYGHVALVRKAAAAFGSVTVVCSVNPIKKEKNIFTPDECKEMWQTYDLGKNIKVVTLEDFLKSRDQEVMVIMIRGIRDNNDIIYENNVMIYNRDNFGITHYHYIIGDKAYEKMSSTAVRTAAKNHDLAKLNELANAQVAAKMIEKFGSFTAGAHHKKLLLI